MSGFVYIWRDRKHKRYYIGSHWGTEDDGYICSSRWMRNAYRRRPDDFKRKIIGKANSREMLYLLEQQWLNMIDDAKLGTGYYNLRKVVGGNLHLSDPLRRKSVGEKISAAKKGKHVSEEHKRKISNTLKGRPLTEETKRKMSATRQINPGHTSPHSAETKQRISQALVGRTLSPETRMKMSLAWSMRKKKKC